MQKAVPRFSRLASCLLFALLAMDARAAFVGNSWDPQGTAGGAPTSGAWESASWSQSTTEAAQATPAAFVEGEAACFAVGDAAATNTQLTITLATGHSVAGIFNGPLAPASCLLTINGPGVITMPGGAQGIDTAGSTPGVTAINTVIAGTGILTAEGTGQLFLNATNTYTGGTLLGFSTTTPMNGVVNFNNGGAFGTGAITVSNAVGGALACTVTTAVTIPNSFVWQQASANMNFVGNAAGVTFAGPWNLINTAGIGSGNAVGNVIIIAGTISGAGGLNKYNPATLRLNGTNTYTGATTVSNGILALGATGSINNTPSISLVPGANGTIFDVSAISAYTIGGSTTLIARGTGTGTATEAAIKGASGGTVSLGSRPINLSFTPTVFTGDTVHSPLFVSQGALTLNSNTVTVTNAAATALGTGTYRLIQVGNGSSGVINGLPNTTPVIAGAGIVAGDAAVLAVSNGNISLLVRPTSSFSPLSITQSNTFGIGATSVTLSGQITGVSLHPASNETVNITINGSLKTTTTKDASGDFSFSFNPTAIPYSATNYTIVLAYGGDASLSPATLTTNVAANVTFVDDFLPGFFSGLNLICTNKVGINMYTWSSVNPGLPITDWNVEGLMQEQPLNDGSGKSRYSINVNPASELVYYVSSPTNGWPYFSPAGVQWITNDSQGDFGFFTTNISISALGVLALPLPPTVVVQPASHTILTGKNAAFNVIVTGSQPMSYQWFFNTNTPVSSLSTNSGFVLTNANTNQSGLYSVFVTNQFGSTNSLMANLTVLPPPQIISTAEPGGFQFSGTVVPGETFWVQSTTNLSPPVLWKTILTNQADTNGLAQFTDTNVAANANLFYRLVFP